MRVRQISRKTQAEGVAAAFARRGESHPVSGQVNSHGETAVTPGTHAVTFEQIAELPKFDTGQYEGKDVDMPRRRPPWLRLSRKASGSSILGSTTSNSAMRQGAPGTTTGMSTRRSEQDNPNGSPNTPPISREGPGGDPSRNNDAPK